LRKLDTAAATDVGPDPGGDLITIEAPTVEAAMERLAAEVGEDARIVSAEKVAKGGLGGFFAKETVVLTARRPEHDRTGLPGVLDRLSRDAETREAAFGDVLRRELAEHRPDTGLGSLLDAAGWGDATGGIVDRPDRQAPDEPTRAPAPVPVGPMASPRPSVPAASTMHDAPIAERIAFEHLVSTPEDHAIIRPSIHVPGLDAVAAAAHATNATPTIMSFEAPTAQPAVVAGLNPATIDAPDSGEPQVEPVAHTVDVTSGPIRPGAPSWSVTELVRHGLPAPVVTAVAGLDSHDDLAWINGLAAAVTPWCGTLPTGDRVVVGTGADRLADALDLPLVRLGDAAPYAGSFCSVVTGAPDDRAWLDFVRGGRYLHFVLGEDELWRDLLVADPAVVSWTSPAGLIDALYIASTLGATLGYGSLSSGEPLLRAQPVDIAFGLRAIVGRA